MTQLGRLWTGTPTPPPTDATSAAAPSQEVAPSPTRLPGGSITLNESPTDPITLTAYEVYDKKLDEDINYARRSLRGKFDKYPGNLESLVSPNGRYLAGRPDDYTSDGYDSILIADRQAGSSFRVKTVRKPLDASIRAWSKDSSKILLNLNKKLKNEQGKEVWTTLGFAVVDVAGNDVAQSKTRMVNVADDSIRDSDFGWDGAEQGVVIVYGEDKGLRFFDAAGKPTRDLPGVGPLAAGTLDLFSPSGRKFVTACPGDDDSDHCLWDAGTGKQIRRVTSDCDKVLGWYDESHLYCWENDNGAHDEVRVVASDGKLLRRLLESPDEKELAPYFTITPTSS
jgi:WD40 repeat protein